MNGIDAGLSRLIFLFCNMIIPHGPDTQAPGGFDLPLTGTEITSTSGRECPIDSGLEHVA